MSTTGPPYLRNAATLLTMISAPTSFGFSARILSPVFTPGPIIMGVFPKKYSHMWTIV